MTHMVVDKEVKLNNLHNPSSSRFTAPQLCSIRDDGVHSNCSVPVPVFVLLFLLCDSSRQFNLLVDTLRQI